jgi:hypothetical protein
MLFNKKKVVLNVFYRTLSAKLNFFGDVLALFPEAKKRVFGKSYLFEKARYSIFSLIKTVQF